MLRKIELKKGWIIENRDGSYLDQNFLWTEVEKENAYVHKGDTNDLMSILNSSGSDVYNIYPAMVFNGHLLLGKPMLRISEEKLMSWN